MKTDEITEGTEYEIIRFPDKRILYSGIAASDTEAEELLESYAMHIRANLNLPYPITLKIQKIQ